MRAGKLLGVHYLKTGDQLVPVILTRNERGSVAGQCLIGDERPIIDGPNVETVLASIRESLEPVVLSRRGA